MQAPALHTAIIARGKIEIFFSFTVGDSLEILTIDREPNGLDTRLLTSMPAGLFRIPGHLYCRTFQVRQEGPVSSASYAAEGSLALLVSTGWLGSVVFILGNAFRPGT